jgi:hypothetical protein
VGVFVEGEISGSTLFDAPGDDARLDFDWRSVFSLRGGRDATSLGFARRRPSGRFFAKRSS